MLRPKLLNLILRPRGLAGLLHELDAQRVGAVLVVVRRAPILSGPGAAAGDAKTAVVVDAHADHLAGAARPQIRPVASAAGAPAHFGRRLVGARTVRALVRYGANDAAGRWLAPWLELAGRRRQVGILRETDGGAGRDERSD